MKSRFLHFGCFFALIGFALSQSPSGDRITRFRDMSRQSEQKGLADAFKGITTNGEVVPNLFPLKSTGVSTEPVRKAAAAFLASLSEEQRKKTLFPIDDPEWRKWMNQHFYVRQGVGFEEMNEAQRKAAFVMMRASLSARGFTQTRDIMKLNETLGELNNNDFEQYGEWKYWITIMGAPESGKPWGWQFDGHHGIINYFVIGDQVVMTPFFAGSEPVIATTGKYKGTKILQEEQTAGLAMINGLDEPLRKKAIIQVSKTGNNNLTEAFKDNVVLDYAGAKGSEMTALQKAKLQDLVRTYVGNMDDGHAKVRMDEVKKHLDNTYFAWIGGTGPESVFYYRVHSPVILIEFDHQSPVGMRHLMKDPRAPFKEHIHSVVRTPNGNDYGKDLLRQHYARYPHSN